MGVIVVFVSDGLECGSEVDLGCFGLVCEVEWLCLFCCELVWFNLLFCFDGFELWVVGVCVLLFEVSWYLLVYDLDSVVVFIEVLV